MSLGISFGGYRSGFPFRMATADPAALGANTPRPLGFTLRQLERLFYRAETLKLSAQFTTFQLIGPDTFSTAVDTDYFYPPPAFSHSKAAATPVAAEVDLLIPLPDNSDTAIFTAAAYPPDFTYAEWTVGTAGWKSDTGTAYGWYSLALAFANTWIHEGLYYPPITFRMYVPTSFVEGGLPLTHNAATDWPVAGTGKSITLIICGASVEIGLGSSLTSPGANPDVEAAGTIEIAPAEYWPYGGKWHAATGARV